MDFIHHLTFQITGVNASYLSSQELLDRYKILFDSIVNETNIYSDKNYNQTYHTLLSGVYDQKVNDSNSEIYAKIFKKITSIDSYKPFDLILIPKSFALELDEKSKCKVLFSEELGLIQIVKILKFPGKEKLFFSKPYTIKDIIDYDMIINNTIERGNQRNRVGNTIAGGLLFGPIGAVAGAILTPSNSTTKSEYVLRLSLNDIKMASIEIPCESREIFYRLVNTLRIFEQHVSQNFEIEEKDHPPVF